MTELGKYVYKGGVGEIVEKKSRFIATVAAVTSREEAEAFVAEMKKKYYDARHNCSAYVIEDTVEICHSNDDGEPSGTAGKPMLEVLLKEGIKNVCVVVTRYFGGTLLGTGGLVRAYQAATKEGLLASLIIEKREGVTGTLTASYTDVGKLQYYFANHGIRELSVSYEENVVFTLLFPSEEEAGFTDFIVALSSGQLSLENREEIMYAILGEEVEVWKKKS